MTHKIPIEDLLLFLEEKEDSFDKKENLFQFVEEHYKLITDISINPLYWAVLDNYCFCDDGTIDTLPEKEGMLLYNMRNGKFGITCNVISTNNIWIFTLNNKNMVCRETYNKNDWSHWGAMSGLYEYADYKVGIDRTLGERDIEVGCIGKDVYFIQEFLINRGINNLIPNGYYDQATEEAIKLHQLHRGMETTGVIKKEQLADFLR